MRNVELERVLRSIQDGHYFLPPEPRRFRVSSLPFCPLLYTIDTMGNPKRKVEFESGFYFHMGHAVHALWQTVASNKLPKTFIGDWQCTRVLNKSEKSEASTIKQCSKISKFCSFREAAQSPCPHKFDDCSAHLVYKELEIAWGGLTGHTDFLYRSKRKTYHLVDIKTTSNFLFEDFEKAVSYGYYPSRKYIEQLETYAVMLENKYKIRITDYTIAYVSRDKAVEIGRNKSRALRLFTYQLSPKLRRARIHNVKRYRQSFEIARKWIEAKPKQRSELTDALYEARPCHRAKDYFEKMSWSFLSKTPCEHHTKGRCYNGKMRKRLDKLAAIELPN